MGKDLGRLRLRQASIQRPIKVIRHLRDLAGSDERADRDQAPVARREGRTEPEVTEENVTGVLHNSWSHCAEVLLDTGSALLLGSLIEGQTLPLSSARLKAGLGISVERWRHPPNILSRHR